MMDGQRQQPESGTATDHREHPDTLRRRRAWNPAAWTPIRSSVTPNRPTAPGDRRFAPTEHLAPEAVAAYVDGELAMAAHMRATHHLALCPECVGAVDAQMAARTRLRSAGTMPIPTDLLGQLSQIPTREFDMSDRLHRPTSAPSPARRPQPDGPARPGSAPIPGQDPTRGRMQRWRSR